MKELRTLFVARQTEIAVPARYEHHVVHEVFPLDFGLLEDHDVGLENVEHRLRQSAQSFLI